MTGTEIRLAPLPKVNPPNGWLLRRLKYVSDVQVSNIDKKTVEGEQRVRLCNYVDVYKNDVITPEMEFMEATATDAQIKNFSLQKGDVLITKDSETWDDIAVPAVVAQDMPDVVCGYHLAHIRPKKASLDGRYLARCFSARGIAEQFFLSANGITRFGLGKDEITGGWFPIPPLSTQQRIADYLDRETMRIDTLIAAKERLLELLGEKRYALITRWVTQGLDPYASFRKTSNPWLPVVPGHWKVERLRWFIRRLEQGWSPQAEDRELDDGGWGVLKLNAVNHGIFDPTKVKALPATLEAPADLQAREGDFLITRSNTPALVGDVCYVKHSPPRLILSDLIYRLRLDEDRIDGRFLSNFLLSTSGRRQIEGDARGTSNSMVKISQEHIKNWWLPVPPLSEQQLIVENAAKDLTNLDALCAGTETTIGLLKERRAALIAAAVTGQLPVEG